MKKFFGFFDFKFIISLTLMVLMVASLWAVKSSNDRAAAESKRSDELIATLHNRQVASDKEWANLKATQHEIYLRYQELEASQKSLLDWLNDSGVVVPPKIVKLLVYVPPKKKYVDSHINKTSWESQTSSC